MKQPDRKQKRRAVATAALAIGLAVTAGCSGASSERAVPFVASADSVPPGSASEPGPAGRLSARRRIPALDFPVAAAAGSGSSGTVVASSVAESSGAASPVAAVGSLFTAAMQGDADTAWGLVDRADQDRVGVKQRLIEQFRSSGFTAFKVRAAAPDSAGNTVTVDVTQTPRISDIDGVIAATATVTVPTVDEGTGFKVKWSRRGIEQHYPEATPAEDALVAASVTAWATDRQNCAAEPINEFPGGLIGVVGLADALCRSSGAPSISAVGDLDSLDEPQPVIEGFGGAALLWARVVKLSAPVKMSVVMAPRGNDWIVVAVSRPSLSDS